MTLYYPDATFLASPLSLWAPHPVLLKQVISQGISLIIFTHSRNIYLGPTMCPKLCQALRESDEQGGSGAYILAEETNIRFNSIVISILKTAQTLL